VHPTPKPIPFRKLTFLSEFRFTLFDRCHDHITHTSIGQSIKMGTETKWSNQEDGLGTTVICAIEDSADWETESQTEFCAGGSTTYPSFALIRRYK
jgi:hypothetical protein